MGYMGNEPRPGAAWATCDSRDVVMPASRLRHVGRIVLCTHSSDSHALLLRHPLFEHYAVYPQQRDRSKRPFPMYRVILVCVNCQHLIGPRKFSCKCRYECHYEMPRAIVARKPKRDRALVTKP